MTYEEYAKLLSKLGYDPEHFKFGHLLRHDSNRNLPQVYFNQRLGETFFVIRREERHHFPETLWTRISPHCSASATTPHDEVVPNRGKEHAAFLDLKARRLERPAIYRT